MTEEDIRYTSWVVSVTSIAYGVVFSIITAHKHAMGFRVLGGYYYTYYLLYFGLILFGAIKMVSILSEHAFARRLSIVSLMFIWGYLWSSSIVESFVYGFNKEAILLIPMLAICGYIAIRGDYR